MTPASQVTLGGGRSSKSSCCYYQIKFKSKCTLSLKPSIFICDFQALSAIPVSPFSLTPYSGSLLYSNSNIETEQSLHLPTPQKSFFFLISYLSTKHLTKANTNMQKLMSKSSVYHPAPTKHLRRKSEPIST